MNIYIYIIYCAEFHELQLLLYKLVRVEGRKVSGETEAHEGPVYALYAYAAADGSGTCLVTGGGDGKVKTWDSEASIMSDRVLIRERRYDLFCAFTMSCGITHAPVVVKTFGVRLGASNALSLLLYVERQYYVRFYSVTPETCSLR